MVLQMENVKVFVKENKQQAVVFGLVCAAVAVALISILVWKLPVIPVCVFLLLEFCLAVCLQNLPIWLHGAVVLIQLLVLANGLFVLLCAAYYVISILLLSIWNKA